MISYGSHWCNAQEILYEIVSLSRCSTVCFTTNHRIFIFSLSKSSKDKFFQLILKFMLIVRGMVAFDLSKATYCMRVLVIYTLKLT